ncbi:GNAT family N-acetyltransferase [Arthrobacter sp. ZGTC212]|uniref:GNAT family N-acetyltransferase n=1 Tax=Arthrobacter sp. ZGTC212 TaxID=2058899 RepID=UPI000CE4765B|nr:GNAT family protein [Arthrobacter sp. ZGTC212]
MLPENLFANQATLTTARLRLEPLGPEHFEGAWASLQDPEARRLTGTHAEFTPEQIQAWLAGLAGQHDRGDWAVIRRSDEHHPEERYLGEVVLNDLDADNGSVGFRIALAPADVRGQGYGTEATAAVVGHAFDDLGLHRVALEVFAFNPRAQRAYEKAGFTVEGRQREALLWDGERVDAISMGILARDPRPALPVPTA